MRATSALFIAVYLLALLSAMQDPRRRGRAARRSLRSRSILVLAVFSAQFLLVPAIVAVGALALRRRLLPALAGA